MAKKKPNDIAILDLDSAVQVESSLAYYHNIQTQLFSVSNPYVGNKRAIIPSIAQALDDNHVQYDSVLDLFGGSGVVSLFMKLIGKRVHYNDLLTSSYYNGLCFVQNTNITLSQSDIDFLCKNDNPDKTSFVRDNFAGRFTAEEALFLDNYHANVGTLVSKVFQEMDGLNCYITSLTRKALMFLMIEHYVMERCFVGGRLNKGQILASLEHRLEHDRNQGHAMKFLLSAPPLFSEGSPDCTASNLDAETVLTMPSAPKMDLLYLDPPYGSSQSDYAQMFSFCEEYIYGAKIDELPHIRLSSKKFVQSKGYEGNFRELLAKCGGFPNWAISYSEASFSDIDGITKILKDFKKNVTVVNIDHEYRYRKDRGSVTEYLIICRD